MKNFSRKSNKKKYYPYKHSIRIKKFIMVLNDILNISGQSGLFKFISKGRNNVIVENMFDKKRTTIPATSRISMLNDISIFTEDETLPLHKVFQKMKEKEPLGTSVSHKSTDAELKTYFAEVLPEYDRNRVYVSDIRKVVLWFNQLIELGITDFELPEEEKKEEDGKKEEASIENNEN